MKFNWENPQSYDPNAPVIIDSECWDTDSALRPVYISEEELSDISYWDAFANYESQRLGGA